MLEIMFSKMKLLLLLRPIKFKLKLNPLTQELWLNYSHKKEIPLKLENNYLKLILLPLPPKEEPPLNKKPKKKNPNNNNNNNNNLNNNNNNTKLPKPLNNPPTTLLLIANLLLKLEPPYPPKDLLLKSLNLEVS